MTSAEGLVRYDAAAGRFAATGTGLRLQIDGGSASAEAAALLGDKNVGIIADYAEGLVTSEAEALAVYAGIVHESASRPGASEWSQLIDRAVRSGSIKLIPVEEFGVEIKSDVTFMFSASGEYLGSQFESSTESGSLSIDDLLETRVVRQADGTQIDTETGRYASYAFFGGRGFVVTFDRPTEG
ncbi:MAG: hypothetical protein ACK4Y9_03700 [Hyphomonas sp.]